jgi:hypothetical protein
VRCGAVVLQTKRAQRRSKDEEDEGDKGAHEEERSQTGENATQAGVVGWKQTRRPFFSGTAPRADQQPLASLE